ncbi:MAG TPA: hypothetical protein VFA45_02240 [Actinomycetes bacterium]|jgi:hypothetical protein|nr:hypothetical protein [Actinomycetes bacterium]
MPSWAVELALTIERPLAPGGSADPPRALLLARAAALWQPMACALGAAIREVDSIAGVGPPLARLRLVRSHPEPGLDPLTRRVVMAHLHAATERGQVIGYRRRQGHDAGSVVAWQPGVGVVLTCAGRAGVSAQALVAVAGQGALSALQPPRGGATVLRGWRCERAGNARGRFSAPDREWAFVAGIVLASTSGAGLGRVARRHAALAREAGWTATALTGAAALELARAGDPRYPPPRTVARYASRESITALLTACLTATTDPTGHLALPTP